MALDPFSQFLGSMGSGVGKGIGDAISGGPAGPMISGGPTDARSGMDGSGWTVSTGRGTATGGARSGTGFDNSGLASGPMGQSSGLMQAGFGTWAMLAMLGLGVVYIAKGGKL